ncbi:hypothetical protein [Dokdonella fugitiva]|jgi:predicted acyltransferase (DUF342 family)|uniref:hypothetical protein n=1 Tax=Dokdonella fugitiva TaxID=328517 RepID=UPI0015FD3843|nr:hypothetical protein [Dokdonella fugitiva]MBA8882998.1 hypothetical protein [Dokdonella fugitiva]
MHCKTALSFALASLLFAGAASARGIDVDKVNGSIHIEGDQQAGALSTVNGSIRIDGGGSATKVSTVNGSIELGDRATAESLETVNGGIDLGAGARISGTVNTVNGGVRLGKGAEIAGRASNVNGRYVLDAAHIGGGIETVSGDIEVGADSRVEGGILVEKPHGWSWGKQRNPRIVIGPHAIVEGTLDFRREVELFVSDTATVGEIKGAKATKFSGDQP